MAVQIIWVMVMTGAILTELLGIYIWMKRDAAIRTIRNTIVSLSQALSQYLACLNCTIGAINGVLPNTLVTQSSPHDIERLVVTDLNEYVEIDADYERFTHLAQSGLHERDFVLVTAKTDYEEEGAEQVNPIAQSGQHDEHKVVVTARTDYEDKGAGLVNLIAQSGQHDEHKVVVTARADYEDKGAGLEVNPIAQSGPHDLHKVVVTARTDYEDEDSMAILVKQLGPHDEPIVLVTAKNDYRCL